MNWKVIRFFVVEDEPEARRGMIQLLNGGDETEVIGEAESVTKALALIPDAKPDALMLDIKLIGGDAFLLLERLRQRGYELPPVVIATGHLDFELAQEATNRFHDHVVHILQKPVLEDWSVKYMRFCDAVRRKLKPKEKDTKKEDVLIITTRKATHQVRLGDIEYIESAGNNSIVIHTAFSKEIRKSEGLGKFLMDSPPTLIRIHRQHAVNKEKIEYIDHEDRLLFLMGVKKGLSIGDRYYLKLKKLLS